MEGRNLEDGIKRLMEELEADDSLDVDAILSDVEQQLRRTQESRQNDHSRQVQKPSKKKRVAVFFGKLMLILLETVLLLVVALYGVMYVLAKGPSPTARDIFVMSVRETSAVGFLANLFFTDEEIAQIEMRDAV